jgi:phosphate transport system protein
MLTSMLALASELERIGDYAKGIATINLRSGGLRLTGRLRDVYEISLKSVDMLQHALTAFELEDPETARSTIGDDALVDSLYNQLYTEVMGSAEDDPENVERLNYVLWVGHNLERIADRATNICERVIFIATGKLEEETSHQDMLFAHQIQNA